MENLVSIVERKARNALGVLIAHLEQKLKSVSSPAPEFPEYDLPTSETTAETHRERSAAIGQRRQLQKEIVSEYISNLDRLCQQAETDYIRLSEQEGKFMIDALCQALDERTELEDLRLHLKDHWPAPSGSGSPGYDLEPKVTSFDASLGTPASEEVSLGDHQPMAVELQGKKGFRADLGMPTVAASSHATGTHRPTVFICPICARSFARRTILHNHQRSHTGEKPFSCKFAECSRSFAQLSDKTRHEKTQHGEKSFVCGGINSKGLSWGCCRAFGRKDGLLEHHRRTEKGKQCLKERSHVMGGQESVG